MSSRALLVLMLAGLSPLACVAGSAEDSGAGGSIEMGGTAPVAGHGGTSGGVAARGGTGGTNNTSQAGQTTSIGGGGASGVAGAVSVAGAGGTPPISSQFKLLWRDEFDNFDTSRWQKAGHDFPENAAQFTPDNATVEGGFLKLRITNTPNNGHAYSAAEIYTNDQFTFGRFEARIKFATGSGIVSSLFTYRDDANHGWNEIDIENLGYITDGVQYNLISSRLGGGALTYQPKVVKTGYNPTQEFHDYAIEWTPVDIRFYVDEKLQWRDVQTRINQPSRLRMNIWPTNNDKTMFAGPLDASKIPAEAQYDWVAVYAYQP
jgi:beta-glucanase (GH16 family)